MSKKDKLDNIPIGEEKEITGHKIKAIEAITNKLMPQLKETVCVSLADNQLMKNIKPLDICPKISEIPPAPELYYPEAEITAENERRRLIEETQIDLLKKVELLEKQLETQAKDQTDTIIASPEQTSMANNHPDTNTDDKTKLKPVIKNNDVDYSGLLKEPEKKDDWFQVIDDMTKEFFNEYKKMPNETLAWIRLWTNPPKGYEITTGNVSANGEECLFMPIDSIKPLSRSAFKKRWKYYTANNAE